MEFKKRLFMRKKCDKNKGKELSVQTLVSTMNKSSYDFINQMNIETDFVIGNQNGNNQVKHLSILGNNGVAIENPLTGLSRNRNLTINYSDADICIIADDDIEYCKGYSDIVKSSFSKYPFADILIFNLYENPIERHVIKRPHRVLGLEFLRYGSVRIAFRRESIKGIISFDERFGAGGDIPIGEDTIFLSDCLKKGLIIYALPYYILSLNESESSWFNGFTKEYFINKGKMYFRIFNYFSCLICFQDAIRHRRQYSSCGNFFTIFGYMLIGIAEMHQL